tara:strand:+ start:32 stop:565 length:534 start_codon:yes stop_codon:yes gene_type:complete
MELEKTKLSDVIRNTNFSAMSNNLILDTTAGVVETVTSVTIISDREDSGITLSTSLSDVSVAGSYLAQFNDYGEFVSKGSSDLIEEPTSFLNIDNLPPNKDFYLFEQDSTDHVIVTYTVTVIYDRETTTTTQGAGEPAPPPVTIVDLEEDLEFIGTFTHKVNNSITIGYNIVSSYYV